MKAAHELTDLDRLIADAVIGIDTLWGGDVMHPSGTGRLIADSWFSGAPLPPAYTHPAATLMRETGGVAAKKPDRQAIESYLAAIDVHGSIQKMADQIRSLPPRRRSYIKGLVPCFEVMWDLAMERLGKGDRVPYERCVRTSTGLDPQPSNPTTKRKRVRELLERSGYPSSGSDELCAAADAWRAERALPPSSIPALSSAFISELDQLTERTSSRTFQKSFNRCRWQTSVSFRLKEPGFPDP